MAGRLMGRGGKRAGAGRHPRQAGGTVRELHVRLGAEEAAALDRLVEFWQVSHVEALRKTLRSTAVVLFALPEPTPTPWVVVDDKPPPGLQLWCERPRCQHPRSAHRVRDLERGGTMPCTVPGCPCNAGRTAEGMWIAEPVPYDPSDTLTHDRARDDLP